MNTSFSKIDGHEFGSFIKKLLPIDKFIFIKIGPDETVSSVYFPQRDAVKLVNVKTEDLFSVEIKKPIKVSFYNGSKVIEALSHFNGELRGSINYSDVDEELMASDFIINDDRLTVNLACADPSLSFMEMNPDQMKQAFDTNNSKFEFDLLTHHVDRIKSLFNLDKDEDIFSFYLDQRGVNIKGKSYDANIISDYESNTEEDCTVTVYKKYLSLLDKENYRVIVCDNKIVFKSLDTDTQLTIATAILDED